MPQLGSNRRLAQPNPMGLPSWAGRRLLREKMWPKCLQSARIRETTTEEERGGGAAPEKVEELWRQKFGGRRRTIGMKSDFGEVGFSLMLIFLNIATHFQVMQQIGYISGMASS
uniref:Uncharacterized protein n=1 Tax=Helianthus annuus TaxID=4232 RepID=A0A251SCW8_HELAN